jgi:hypothetical protein
LVGTNRRNVKKGEMQPRENLSDAKQHFLDATPSLPSLSPLPLNKVIFSPGFMIWFYNAIFNFSTIRSINNIAQ